MPKRTTDSLSPSDLPFLLYTLFEPETGFYNKLISYGLLVLLFGIGIALNADSLRDGLSLVPLFAAIIAWMTFMVLLRNFIARRIGIVFPWPIYRSSLDEIYMSAQIRRKYKLRKADPFLSVIYLATTIGLTWLSIVKIATFHW